MRHHTSGGGRYEAVARVVLHHEQFPRVEVPRGLVAAFFGLEVVVCCTAVVACVGHASVCALR